MPVDWPIEAVPARAVASEPVPDAREQALRARRELEQRRDEARENRVMAQESRRRAEQTIARADKDADHWAEQIKAYDELIHAVVQATPSRQED